MKKRVIAIITVGIVLLVSLSLYEYFTRPSQKAEADKVSGSASGPGFSHVPAATESSDNAVRTVTATGVPNVSETLAPSEEELPVSGKAWAKGMKRLKSQKIKRVSTFVQGKECFSSDKKMISAMKGIISRLTMKKTSKLNDGLEGGWKNFQIYGDEGILYSLEIVNSHEDTTVYMREGKRVLCCDIPSADQKRLYRISKKMYDKFAVDIDDE